jgi:hypothetical protein
VFFSDNKAEALHGDAFNRLLDNFEKTTCAKGAWLMQEGEVRNSTENLPRTVPSSTVCCAYVYNSIDSIYISTIAGLCKTGAVGLHVSVL